MLLIILAVLFVKAFVTPLGTIMDATGSYIETPFVQGFQDGYQTMDLLASLAIGTLVAMSIRTIEFAYHTNKYILNRNIIKSVKKILVIIIEVLLVVFLSNYLPNINIISYLTLIKYAILVLILTVLIVLPINILVFKKEFKEIINILKNIFKKKEKK